MPTPSEGMTKTQAATSFKSKYPTKESVEEFFKPQEWWKVIGNEEVCYKAPYVAIGDLDGMYNTVGLGFTVIRKQMMGLFNMTAPSGTNPNQEAIEITSKMFFSENRGASIYQVFLYFACYQSRFKSKRSYQSFDTGDILSAYKTNFLPYWQQLAAKYDDRVQRARVSTSREPTGEEALAEYITRKVDEYGGGERGIDEFMQHSGMVACGYLSRSKIRTLLASASKPY